jgi:hypothetical protein
VYEPTVYGAGSGSLVIRLHLLGARGARLAEDAARYMLLMACRLRSSETPGKSVHASSAVAAARHAQAVQLARRGWWLPHWLLISFGI